MARASKSSGSIEKIELSSLMLHIKFLMGYDRTVYNIIKFLGGKFANVTHRNEY
jgi:hypothetical protein